MLVRARHAQSRGARSRCRLSHPPGPKLPARIVCRPSSQNFCDKFTELGEWGAELLRPSSIRSWVERDLYVGDLRVLSDVAFRRTVRLPFGPVERLCKRGFLVQTTRAPGGRMTLKGGSLSFSEILLRDRSTNKRTSDLSGALVGRNFL